MTSELVVDVQPKEISIALMEDKNLVEFQKEEQNLSFAVGNMYLGRVKKLMPGLNACFVDVGFEKDAFLHYLDLGPQFHSYQKPRYFPTSRRTGPYRTSSSKDRRSSYRS